MKTSILLLIPIALSACATRTPVVRVTSIPGTTLPSEGIENVRYAENLKAYPLGRYIDPNNGRIMHEGHTIYRVESTAKWNLHPNQPVFIPVVRRRDAAKVTVPNRDELMVEFNHQKEVTKAVIQGSQTVSQKLGDLSANLQQTKQVAEQNVRLEQELSTTKQRLDLLENELRKQQRPTPPAPKNAESDKSDW